MIELLISGLRVIIGIPLVLFVPGYLIALRFFKEMDTLEKIGLGFIFSISIDLVVGLILGYNRSMRELTGGITEMNLWVMLMFITVFLLGIYIKPDKTKKHRSHDQKHLTITIRSKDGKKEHLKIRLR